MPKETDDDSRIARKLDCAPEQVVMAKAAWLKNNIMRAVHEFEIDRLIESLRTELETISPELLKSKQGEINGLRKARGVILRSEK